MKRFLASYLLFLLSLTGLWAQSTKVRGKVIDERSGEAVPFAGVFFKGTTIGTTTELDGTYSLETRTPGDCIVVCQLLGYDIVEKKVKESSFNEVNFELRLSNNEINSVIVKADNSRIKRLLKNIASRKADNDPDQKPGYECELYNKIELGLTNAKEQITNKRFLKEFGFVFDYMDTSAVSGVPYLPVLISESVAKRQYEKATNTDREVVLANKISGINKNNNLLSQFTGSAYLKNNFYKDYVNTFGVEFPSPIQESGLTFYNYFIIDSLSIDGRKNLLVRFHPKKGISSPALDGQMHIDAEDFALTDIKARMVRSGNVNWIRDLEVEVSYRKDSSGCWFYDSDRMYCDFSVTLSESSKMISALGNRQVFYTSHQFNNGEKVELSDAKVSVEDQANHKDEAYWDEKRPYELSKRERDIYTMVDAIKEQRLYKDIYTAAETIVNGYLDLGKIGIGPYARLISFDELQGFRVQVGMHTSKDFSTKHRLSGYVAYGFRDKGLKGGVMYERMFRKSLTRKLSLDVHYDERQLGHPDWNYTEGTVFTSLNWGRFRLAPQLFFKALYEHEFSPDFNTQADIIVRRQFSNFMVPMVGWDGRIFDSVASNELHLQFRYSHDEIVNRGHFTKTYLNTLYPIVTLDLNGSIAGLRKNDFSYFSPSLTVDWKIKLPPVGVSKLRVSGGTVIGAVPYPFLHIYPGDMSFFKRKFTFSCMDYMEFAADSWAHVFLEHDFGGFFLGKIPLLKKLNWREVFTLKAAFGNLSDKNNGIFPQYHTMMRFPEGMKTLKEPYVEIGAGLCNILRLFRVDCTWRLTNLENARRIFTVTGGIEIKF